MGTLTRDTLTASELRSIAEKIGRSKAAKKGARNKAKTRLGASEDQIQQSVAKYLNMLEGQGHLLWFHVPNGGKRGLLEAIRFQRMGVKAGVPDVVVIPKTGPVCFIELKSEDGKLSLSQRQWLASLPDFGCPTVVCRSLDEVRQFLFETGIVREA